MIKALNLLCRKNIDVTKRRDLTTKEGIKRLMKMFAVKFEREKKSIEITFSYPITETSTREFKLNRNLEEPLGRTFDKVIGNLNKQILAAQKKKKVKKLKNDAAPSEGFVVENDNELNISVALLDANDREISRETLNEVAWREDYKVRINDRVYKISVDLPTLRKVALPKLLMANMPVILSVDDEDANCVERSRYSWHVSTKEANNGQWTLFCEGINKRMVTLDESFVNKFVRIVCTPSDGNREGLPVEVVSQKPVQKLFDIDSLPMTARHKLTTEKLAGNELRVVTYNVLAKVYADTAMAKNSLFPYIDEEHLDYKYRRPLLIHEIKNYNADVIFLQECDEDFFENEIRGGVCTTGYSGFIKIKGDSREGEAVLFREDRFKHIRSYDIRITNEIMNNPLYMVLWENICKSDAEMKDLIENRNTVLQLVLVECVDKPGKFILLANTHLFFHPAADFIRLIQSVVSAKHIESILHTLVSDENKNATVLFAGDFNSDPPSYAIQYLFTQQLPLNDLPPEKRALIDTQKDILLHSLSLTTFAQFQYTNYIETFNCVLDYIFYEEQHFNLKRVIPMPTHEQVTQHVALPSKCIPSDHLAVVLELEWKI